MDTLAFISKYEAILKSKKIPKMQFYKDCGITDAAVSQWRKGKTNPAMTTISRISEYLEVSVAYLLGEEEQKEKPTLQTESERIPGYSKLSDTNRAIVDSMIAQLLAAQSED